MKHRKLLIILSFGLFLLIHISSIGLTAKLTHSYSASFLVYLAIAFIGFKLYRPTTWYATVFIMNTAIAVAYIMTLIPEDLIYLAFSLLFSLSVYKLRRLKWVAISLVIVFVGFYTSIACYYFFESKLEMKEMALGFSTTNSEVVLHSTGDTSSVQLIQIWHLSCPPCLRQHRSLLRLSAELSTVNASVHFINTDTKENNIENAKQYVADEQIHSYFLADGYELSEDLPIQVQPTLLMVQDTTVKKAFRGLGYLATEHYPLHAWLLKREIARLQRN